MERMLDGIERLGNKMPDPAILFLWLCLGVILLSQVAGLARRQGDLRGRRAAARRRRRRPTTAARRDPVYVAPDRAGARRGLRACATETTEVKGLLTVDGVRFLFTSFVDNFRNFAAVAIILVVMIGVGLAEAAGLIGALIRKLVAVSSPGTLTFIIVLLGMVSSVASDAGYLVLIPLGRGGVQERRAQPAGGHRGRVRRRRRRLRGELPDHAAGRRADRDHQRRVRAGRPERGDRPRGEPVLRHRLGAVRHRRC